MTLTRHAGLGAFLLGMGLIAMVDGIVFHQLLQWHNTVMHTDRFHRIQSDGYLHLFSTALMFAGAWVLWRSEQSAGGARLFWGGLLMGAGFFNLVEGLVDHHLLQVHHVRPGAHELAWDLAYDLIAVGLFLLGLAVYWTRQPDSRATLQ